MLRLGGDAPGKVRRVAHAVEQPAPCSNRRGLDTRLALATQVLGPAEQHLSGVEGDRHRARRTVPAGDGPVGHLDVGLPPRH